MGGIESFKIPHLGLHFSYNLMKKVLSAVDVAFDLWSTGFKNSNMKQPSKKEKWRPPDPGVTKINIDGAFKVISMEGATGAIARTNQGNFIMPLGGSPCRYWWP